MTSSESPGSHLLSVSIALCDDCTLPSNQLTPIPRLAVGCGLLLPAVISTIPTTHRHSGAAHHVMVDPSLPVPLPSNELKLGMTAMGLKPALHPIHPDI
jgi:hypothetical protein